MIEQNAQRGTKTPTANRPNAGDAAVSPVGRLVPVLGLWGGGVALVSIAASLKAGVSDSSAIAAATVFVAAGVSLGLLSQLSPRPISQWAFPVLGAQMMRTLLAPALGLAVYFAAPMVLPMGGEMAPKAFWLTLLAVAAAMLVGETIAVSKMFGSASPATNAGTPGQEAVA